MNYTDLVIDPYKTIGRTLLVNVLDVTEYKNGLKTDNIIGYKYEVAMIDHNLDKISIKILGKKLMDAPENFVEVTFDNLELYLYMMNGNLQIGARATGISAVSTK